MLCKAIDGFTAGGLYFNSQVRQGGDDVINGVPCGAAFKYLCFKQLFRLLISKRGSRADCAD